MKAKIIQFNYNTFNLIFGFFDEKNLVIGSRCIRVKYCQFCKQCGYCSEEMSKYIDIENKKILISECEIPEQLSEDEWNSWIEYWSFIAFSEYEAASNTTEIIISAQLEGENE